MPVMDPKNPMTPGVYIQELNAFPNSVVEVATAIPAFIGYTQRASYNGQSFAGQAVKITSLNDYQNYFGTGPSSVYNAGKTVASPYMFSVNPAPPKPMPTIPDSGSNTVPVNLQNNSLIQTLTISAGGAPPAPYYLTLNPAGNFYLYNSIRLFYQNGGGTAYIISIGDYTSSPKQTDFTNALTGILANYSDPTLIVFPDALLLGNSDYASVLSSTLNFCAQQQNLFSVFDVWGGGYADTTTAVLTALQSTFRNNTGVNALNYGTAYFPWLQTGVVQSGEINFLNLPDMTKLLETSSTLTAAVQASLIANVTAAQNLVAKDLTLQNQATIDAINLAHNALYAQSVNYKIIADAATAISNVLPAAPAMVGIYTMVDNVSGVWQAPANVSLTNVVTPTANLNDLMQQSFNVDAATGKSINVIRAFSGQGILVWGARTLDGNSQDWRYVNVRRTMIMIEQSVKAAARAYVFQPNVANTWASIKSMLSNFLQGLWKQGALAGSKAEDAYSVSVGLGSTMTSEDILNGVMNITVLVAITHPAEFLVFTFQQQMQTS